MISFRKKISLISLFLVLSLLIGSVPAGAATAAASSVPVAGDEAEVPAADVSSAETLPAVDTASGAETPEESASGEEVPTEGALGEEVPEEGASPEETRDESDASEEAAAGPEDTVPEMPLHDAVSGRVTAGVYRITAYGYANLALTVTGSGLASRDNIALGTTREDYSQLFYLAPQSDGTYIIENVGSGFVMDADTAGTVKGTNIRQYKANGTVAQNWKLTESAAGVYTIGAAYCPLVLDIDTARMADGTNIRLWKSNGTAAQQWQLSRVADPLPAGTYFVKNTGSGLIMEAQDDSRALRSNVSAGSYTGGDYQKLIISTPDNGATYRLRFFSSRLTLDVTGGSKLSGTNIQQYKVNNTPAQSFRIIPLGKGTYKILSCLSQMPLTVTDGNVCVSTAAAPGDGSQTWTFEAADTSVKPGMYFLVSAKDTAKVADITGGSWLRKTNVQLYSRSKTSSIVNQQFILTAVSDDWFTITNVGSGKVFDKAGGAASPDNDNVWQYTANGSEAQLWRFESTGDGDGSYYIINGLGKYLDIQGGETANGTNIQVHKGNRTAAQKWCLESTTFGGRGWKTDNQTERRYYRDGKYLTGWKKLGNDYYYFYPETGSMAYKNDKGVSPVIDGYTFDTEGRRVLPKASDILADVKPGGGTLLNMLQNALIPCGRVLYVWGGGWGNTDANKIGYLPSWGSFFNTHATPTYNRNDYRYAYGSGLDCSGYVSWVVYNANYKKNDQANILYGNGTSYNSTKLAQRVSSLGFGTYNPGAIGSYTYLRPGDIVSMSGHVWIYLGSCPDGSGVILHSSPMGDTYGGGVQLAGTKNKAGSSDSDGYRLAKAYMEKYFSYWPYAAHTAGDDYRTSAVGYCRWRNDPDGLKKMSAAEVLETILGKL